MFDAASAPTLTARLPSPGSARSIISLGFARRGATTTAVDRYEAGNLRARFPRNLGHCQAVLINTGGGIVGGDRLNLDFAVAAGAAAVVTGQAAEKIYRTDALAAVIDVRFQLAPGARLAWLPQETILYNGARLERRLAADLAPDASLTIVEMTVFGRTASGEALRSGTFRDRWDVRVGGRLVFAERVRLEDDMTAKLERVAIGGGAVAAATLVHVAPAAGDRLARLRAALANATCDCGVTAIGDMVIARFLGRDPAAVRNWVASALARGLGLDLPRSWSL